MTIPYCYPELKEKYRKGLFKKDSKGNLFTYESGHKFYVITYEGEVVFTVEKPTK